MHHFPFQNTFRSPHGVRSAFSDAKAGNQSAWSVLIKAGFCFRDQIFAPAMSAKIAKISLLTLSHFLPSASSLAISFWYLN
jgi:hypothetical protein